jgi:hypothetical protein
VPSIVYSGLDASSNPTNDHVEFGEWRRDDLKTWRGKDLPPIGATLLITEFANQDSTGTHTQSTGAKITDVAVIEQTYRAVPYRSEGIATCGTRSLCLHIWLEGRVSPIELDLGNPYDGWTIKTSQMDRDRAEGAVRGIQLSLRRQLAAMRKAGTPEALCALLAHLDEGIDTMAQMCQTIKL